MSVIDSSILKALGEIVVSPLLTDVTMADISSWRVGGKARVLVQPSSLEEIIKLRQYMTKHQLPNLVIGNTTNLLFTDEAIDAVILKIGRELAKVELNNHVIVAQAGVWMPKLARIALQAGLSGIEHTCGIPGTLGGLAVMNGGSQRKAIGDNILYVRTVDAKGVLKKYDNPECLFGYRRSIFQELDEIIVEVALQLKPTRNKLQMHKEILSILRARSKKFPRKWPNCGSVFVSNPAMYEKYGPPGKIIEECGLKGLKKGGAKISYNHANFIINNDGASAKDILYLIDLIRDRIYKSTGYLMKVEPKLVEPLGVINSI